MRNTEQKVILFIHIRLLEIITRHIRIQFLRRWYDDFLGKSVKKLFKYLEEFLDLHKFESNINKTKVPGQ